jgi:hypothetical protein
MAYIPCMQYTIRDIPPHLDVELRERARRENKSLNQVAIEALAHGLDVAGVKRKRRSLDDIAGTWKKDPAVEKAIAAARRLDPKLWR